MASVLFVFIVLYSVNKERRSTAIDPTAQSTLGGYAIIRGVQIEK
jgi:hypothetical protein